MNEPIIFKVNDLSKGNGFVHTISTFNKNVNNIRPNYHDELKKELAETGREQVMRFEVAGRFVVVVSMSKDFETVQMAFFDLKKDDQLAKKVVDSIIRQEEDERLQEELAVDFLFAFKRCNLTYDEYYDFVELELDVASMN